MNFFLCSASRFFFSKPPSCDFAEGLLLAAFFHEAEVLNLAAFFWQTSTLLAQTSPADKARWEHLDGLARVFAHLLVVHLDGWQRFCADQQIEPRFLLDNLP